MVCFNMRKKLLVWLYTRIELVLTQAFRHFRNLAFQAAKHEIPAVSIREEGDSKISLGDNVGIVITTFEQRFDVYAIPLIKSFRQAISNPIYLVVNGNYDGPPSTSASRKLLSALSQFDNVYPIFLGKMYGCSSLWNIGIRHSNLDLNFVFNDDISIDERTVASEMQTAVSQLSDGALATINHSWSHFLISRLCMNTVGPFDERFLGFGEEDGDYIRRIVDMTGQGPVNVLLDGFINIIDQSRDESVAVSWGKYSLFNKCLYFIKYPESINDEAFNLSEPWLIPSLDTDLDSIRRFREQHYSLLVCDDPKEIMRSIIRFYN